MRRFCVPSSYLAAFAIASSFTLTFALSWQARESAIAQQPKPANNKPANNIPKGARGELPKGTDGRTLNLDFETGTLQDWTATGKAFEQQPIKGPIDQNRPFGSDKRSDHTGEFWIGGYEKLQDGPKGTLTSARFAVTHPYASFLIGGGDHKQTRVELVIAGETPADDKVLATASGRNLEEMRPVVVDLKNAQGKLLFIRIVDDHAGGWGHVNFDDFRFHATKPEFPVPVVPASSELLALYPNAGLDPEAAAKAMEVPPGFKVQVGAAEPNVQQPVAMAIDDRGRVWIAEAFEYPRRAKEGEGHDRILVFEDTDLDGSLDKRTVFVDNVNLVTGLEVGFGGVWVGAAPYLLFIPDKDGDDKPDGPPEVVLDGWGDQDTHETLNSFIWGPDGWLYGCHGVFTHSNVGAPGAPEDQRTRINAGIWRFHPVRHTFEVFAHGTSNPWGVDFDANGQAFATACVIPHLFHIIHNARYERQAGAHFNEFTYDDIKTIADHRHYTGNQWNNNDRRSSDSLGGGHAHAGAMIYQGGAWPEAFRGKLFMNNIHGNRLNMDVLVREGSGFVGSHGPDFLLTRDQWSQMLYLTYGPDGQAWVIDWYDANQCHRNDPDVHDRSNGRIYRISHGDVRPVKVDLAKSTDLQLVEYLTHSNQWYVRHSRRLLQERAAANKLAANSSDQVFERLARLLTSKDVPAEHATAQVRLHALWTLHAMGALESMPYVEPLGDADEFVRAWSVQLAAERWTSAPADAIPEALLDRLARMAKDDPSPVVRLYLASALQRLPPASRWNILDGLTSHAEDAKDHNLPLMYWYAAEPLATVDAQRALVWALEAGPRFPQIREFMIRRIAASKAENSLALLVTGLSRVTAPELELAFLRGISDSLKGKTRVDAPPGWADVYGKLGASESAEVRRAALGLAVTFGDPMAAGTLRAVVADSKAELAARREALAALQKAKDAELVPVLIRMLEEPPVRGDALRSLAAFDSATIPTAILAIYGKLPQPEQRDALATLSARSSSAQTLLEAVDRREIPAAHLSADLVRQLRNLNDKQLNETIERVWGVVRESPEERLKLMEHYKRLAQPGGAGAPDLELGRAVFAKTCQQCHTLFGTGAKIGPDLTGSNRANLDYLLSNVVDPSAVLAKEYQPTIIVTSDGRVLTGLIKQETPDALVIQTANELVTVPKADVDERKLSEKSMMPDDLLKPLTDREVRSLIAYLALPGQVPQLATVETAKNLFNGRDLTLWRGDAKLWSVDNGEIVGRSPGLKHNEFLVSELAVEDFRLTLEVKLTPNKENSGIQFRSEPQANGEVKGYQADVGAGWWGKLYEELGRGLLWNKSGEQHVKVDEWNRYEIVAEGTRVRTWINGQPCVDLDDPDGRRRGVFALQLHSGGPLEVRYRNLQLELLTPSK